MVHKTSHRGVHSGNTLRGFNCRYSRRYHHQSCIVSRIRPELLEKLVRSASEKVDDKRKIPAAPNNNVAVDVALSLNKQWRWLLPKALITQVSSNDVALSDLTVSVLERHKLKRPSNCVSFHSNRGEIRRIQPRNGRYFSFAFPSADGKSRRAARREQREERRELMRQKEFMGTKTVDVFPERLQGAPDPNLELGESEIRYEVFYPSSARCSISHNLKYIKKDVASAPGDEVNSEHVQFGKPRKQHRGRQRKRMTLKDLDECDLPAYSDAVYQDDRRQVRDPNDDNDDWEDEVLQQAVEEEDSKDEEDQTRRQQTTECLLSSLIEKAEQLQNIVDGKSLRRRKKSGSKSKGGQGLSKGEELGGMGRSRKRIVYMSELDEQKLNKDVREDEEGAVAVTDDGNDDLDIVHVSATSLTEESPHADPAEVTRVILPNDDVTVDILKDCFGSSYFEGSCLPRKFLLDITQNVSDLFKKRGIAADDAQTTEKAVSYLIFTHDGFYDEGHDVYKVDLNSNLLRGPCPVQLTNVDSEGNVQEGLYRGTVMKLISKTVDFADTILVYLIAKNHIGTTKGDIGRPDLELKFEDSARGSMTQVTQKAFNQGSEIDHVSIPTLEELLADEPAFCDVCYSDVSPLTQDSAGATTLLSCRHRVCDLCWSKHLLGGEDSACRLTCPAHDCQEGVDVGVLLSLVSVKAAGMLLHREENIRVGASSTEKFCPDKLCGRIIRLPPNTATETSDPAADVADPQQDVMCVCGNHVCFQCLSPAHWPATCPQAAQYRATLATPGALPDRASEVHEDRNVMKKEEPKTMAVQGKHCPKCDRFLTKEGGNSQMACVCGLAFCWFCLKPSIRGDNHDNRGRECVSAEAEKKRTTTYIFHAPEKEEEKDKMVLPKKVSLVERAAEHRQRRMDNRQYTRAVNSLANAVVAAAAKDAAVARHVVSVCTGMARESSPGSVSSAAKSETSVSNSTTSTSRAELQEAAAVPASQKTSVQQHESTPPLQSILQTVTTFLKTAVRCKQELHEVAEYTLVLLKDIPDSVLRRRALRISEDLGAFCSFAQSILDGWSSEGSGVRTQQDAVRAVTRMAEIQSWARTALASHVVTVKKIRSSYVTSAN